MPLPCHQHPPREVTTLSSNVLRVHLRIHIARVALSTLACTSKHTSNLQLLDRFSSERDYRSKPTRYTHTHTHTQDRTTRRPTDRPTDQRSCRGRRNHAIEDIDRQTVDSAGSDGVMDATTQSFSLTVTPHCHSLTHSLTHPPTPLPHFH